MAVIPSCTFLVGDSLQARFRLVWLSARKLGRFWLVPPIDQRRQTDLGLSLALSYLHTCRLHYQSSERQLSTAWH